MLFRVEVTHQSGVNPLGPGGWKAPKLRGAWELILPQATARFLPNSEFLATYSNTSLT